MQCISDKPRNVLKYLQQKPRQAFINIICFDVLINPEFRYCFPKRHKSISPKKLSELNRYVCVEVVAGLKTTILVFIAGSIHANPIRQIRAQMIIQKNKLWHLAHTRDSKKTDNVVEVPDIV